MYIILCTETIAVLNETQGLLRRNSETTLNDATLSEDLLYVISRRLDVENLKKSVLVLWKKIYKYKKINN